MLRADIESVLVSKEQIEQKITQLGRQITSDYHGKEIILACILRGSFIFAADLARHIDVPMTIEFLSASSYAKGTETTGNVQIRQDFEVDISGKHVLLVEDIIDTGLTLSRLRQMLNAEEKTRSPYCRKASSMDTLIKTPLDRLTHGRESVLSGKIFQSLHE